MPKSGMQFMIEQLLGSFGIDSEQIQGAFNFASVTLPVMVKDIQARFETIQRGQQAILAEQAEIKNMIFEMQREHRENSGDVLPAQNNLTIYEAAISASGESNGNEHSSNGAA